MNVRTLGLGWLAAATLAALAGCSSSSVVTLQDGTQYVTKDSPRTHTRDGFVQFTDISGRHIRVRADEVATIKEED